MRWSVRLFAVARRAEPFEQKTQKAPDKSVITKDRFRLFIRAGNGGHGLSRYNGIGGTGGYVYARPMPKMDFQRFCAQFQDKKPEVIGQDGQNAKQVQLVGKHGADKTLDVPVGVEIVGRNSVLLARCTVPKQRYVLAVGGKGGCAANNYVGEKSDSCWVDVHLKLSPNVGLVGFPNAGKSTLMKALVPGKRIEIADYAFTTRRPQLCYIKYGGKEDNSSSRRSKNDDDTMSEQRCEKEGDEPDLEVGTPFTLSIVDLPGIVEGAAQNRFRAFDCLKHLEHSDIIVMIVDVHGFQLGPNEPHRTPLETMALLNREMEAYDRRLVMKPVVLLVNKVDLADGEQKAQQLCEFLIADGAEGEWAKHLPDEQMRPRYAIHFCSVHAVSAKQKRLGNLKQMLKDIHRRLNPLKAATFEEDLYGKGVQKVLV